MTSPEPTALVLCLRPDWIAASRLPERLAAGGLGVSVICPEGALIALARPVQRLKTFRSGSWAGLLPALEGALRELDPALLLPGDDDARLALQDLHGQLKGPDALRALIETSLGDPAHFPDVARKSALLDMPGLPQPEGLRPENLDEALAFAQRVGYPVVLKRDFSSGGSGVQRCADTAELTAAHQRASAQPSGRGGRLLLQRWVEGPTISSNFAAWGGELLAACTSLRERVHPEPLGVVSLARLLPDHPALALARRVVRHFGLSGLGSVQCLLDGASGQPLVMELNSRVTPMSVASPAFGVDLVGALAARVRGATAPVPETPAYERVALFPNEWRRDPQSPALRDPAVCHDVPWSQPELLSATVQHALRWG